MIYGEIVIGMPGSGKTTYIAKKREYLSNRNIFTVNLDPGCLDSSSEQIEYDFDIRKFYTTKNSMEEDLCGPNLAVKSILKDFCSEYATFNRIFADEEAYYLIDTPGQIESIVILEKFLSRLQKDNIRLITVFLIEIASFVSYDTMAYTYLISLQTMVSLNNTQINVITKCDLLNKIETIAQIDDIANLSIDTEKVPDFFRVLYEFVERESLLVFELLDYKDQVLSTLQYTIDQASGFLYEITEEKKLNEYLKDVQRREDILQEYIEISKKK